MFRRFILLLIFPYFSSTPLVSAFISLGMGVGIALGQGIAGYLGPIFGWRLPFLVVSLPALVSASLVGVFVTEPKRGSSEKAVISPISPSSFSSSSSASPSSSFAHEDECYKQFPQIGNQIEGLNKSRRNSNTINWNTLNDTGGTFDDATNMNESYQENTINTVEHDNSLESEQPNGCLQSLQSTINLCKTKTVLLLVIQGIPGCVPWGIVNVYLSDYLSNDQGMTIEVS